MIRSAAITSGGVIEELLRFELQGRPEGLEGLARDAHVLLGPVLAVTDEVIADALTVSRPWEPKRPGPRCDVPGQRAGMPHRNTRAAIPIRGRRFADWRGGATGPDTGRPRRGAPPRA